MGLVASARQLEGALQRQSVPSSSGLCTLLQRANATRDLALTPERYRAAAWATRCRRYLIVLRSALRARRLVEGGAQSLGKLYGVVIGPEVHEEQPRLLVEHVAVDRRHLDAVRPQRLDHWVHLFCGQHEIASDGGLAAAGRLEADRRGHPRGPRGSKL